MVYKHIFLKLCNKFCVILKILSSHLGKLYVYLLLKDNILVKISSE